MSAIRFYCNKQLNTRELSAFILEYCATIFVEKIKKFYITYIMHIFVILLQRYYKLLKTLVVISLYQINLLRFSEQILLIILIYMYSLFKLTGLLINVIILIKYISYQKTYHQRRLTFGPSRKHISKISDLVTGIVFSDRGIASVPSPYSS